MAPFLIWIVEINITVGTISIAATVSMGTTISIAAVHFIANLKCLKYLLNKK